MTEKEILRIAKAAHEVNKALCKQFGDTSQPTWEDAPEWQVESIVCGVKAILENPDMTPSHSHDGWLKKKVESGWSWGRWKNPEKKQHPCILPYEQLPRHQKAKDKVFREVVLAVASLIGNNT